MAITFPDPAVTNPYTDPTSQQEYLFTNGAWQRAGNVCFAGASTKYPSYGVSATIFPAYDMWLDFNIWTPIKAQGVLHDPDGNFDEDGLFTAPETGRYLIMANSFFQMKYTNYKDVYMQIYINGLAKGFTKLRAMNATTAKNRNSLILNNILQLSSGDTVEVKVRNWFGVAGQTIDLFGSAAQTSVSIEKMDRTDGIVGLTGFHYSASGDFAMTQREWYKVTSWATQYHLDGFTLDGTEGFIVPAGKGGRYFFAGNFSSIYGASTDNRIIEIRNQNNKTLYRHSPPTRTNYNGNQMSGILYLDAGDIVSMHYYCDGSYTSRGVATHFAMEYLDVAFPNTDYASVYLNTLQVIPNSTQTAIKFDIANYDDGSNMNLTTGLYTCPADGRYLIIGQVSVTGCTENDFDHLYIAKNGNGRQTHYVTVSTITGAFCVAGTMECLAGDTLGINYYSTSTNSIAASVSGTRMDIEYLG